MCRPLHRCAAGWLGPIPFEGPSRKRRESLSTQDSRVSEENEQDLIKAGTIESQVESTACDGIGWQDYFNGKVNRIQECTTKSVQCELEQCSIPGREQKATLHTLVRVNIQVLKCLG